MQEEEASSVASPLPYANKTKTTIMASSWAGALEESESETMSDTSGIRINDFNNKKYKYKIPQMDESQYEG
jgi:hypothetical protein